MPGLCTSCHAPASDEYHFYEYVPAMSREVEVTWDLCGRCCEFAIDVVESISNLEWEVERWK